MDKEDLIDELKAYLQSAGWDTLQVETVIDGVVASFDNELLPEGLATYDEVAKNLGVGIPPSFDETAIELLDKIKQL